MCKRDLVSVGGSASDTLFGDWGDDIYDSDSLNGGDDTLVIGQKNNVFYNDGNPDAKRTGDYALITDCQLGIDRLDVAG